VEPARLWVGAADRAPQQECSTGSLTLSLSQDRDGKERGELTIPGELAAPARAAVSGDRAWGIWRRNGNGGGGTGEALVRWGCGSGRTREAGQVARQT
jgi:hypothetical protein